MIYQFVIFGYGISDHIRKIKKDIQLLVTVAEKMGIKARLLSKDDLEDFGMGKAIIEGKTGEFIDTKEFLKSLI